MNNVIDFMKYKVEEDIKQLHKDIWECIQENLDKEEKWFRDNCPEYEDI